MTVAVIGAGAAGLFAAGLLAQKGSTVLLFEKNSRAGRKLNITGKGRCNVTNDCSPSELMANTVSNPKFLYSAYNAFSPADTKAFFESLGVPLKTERGRRVFPESDRATDITDALVRFCADNGVKFIYNEVVDIEKNEKFHICTKTGSFSSDKIVITCGGISYPSTGSTGDGYAFARKLGHSIKEPALSLVPLRCGEALCNECEGLTLKNVRLTVKHRESGKKVFSEMGELLFTSNGISGPLALSASAYMRGDKKDYALSIDLKPALDHETLDKRLLSDFSQNINKDYKNSLSALLPSKLIAPFVKLSQIDQDKKVNSITAKERHRISELLKHLPLTVTGTGSAHEAVITQGGVSTAEIDPKTMMSKIVPDVYFAGEVIDVDALTGGYNLQIAFSTAYVAAKAASKE